MLTALFVGIIVGLAITVYVWNFVDPDEYTRPYL